MLENVFFSFQISSSVIHVLAMRSVKGFRVFSVGNVELIFQDLFTLRMLRPSSSSIYA